MIKALLMLESGESVPIQIRKRNIKYLIYAMSKQTRWRQVLRGIRKWQYKRRVKMAQRRKPSGRKPS